jgi:predicted Zn-dependent protease with MMP-like domain
MTRWAGCHAPSLADIEEMALAARDAIPAPFQGGARQVAIRVEDFATDEVLDAMEIDDPYELTGLYDGIPLTQKSVLDTPQKPDAIWLFRAAILDEWAARGDVALDRLVAHVYVHELAHHFGWSDADIARVDRWWE